MKKTVRVEREQTVFICDLCGKQTENNGCCDTCFCCHREVCYGCRDLLFYVNPGECIDFPKKVCKRCQGIMGGQLRDKVQSVLDGANKQLAEWVGMWKKLGEKERKESKQ